MNAGPARVPAGLTSKIKWAEPWGDRRQEIVFIGADFDWPTLKQRLDACLIADAGLETIEALPDLPDPLPRFQVAGG